MTKDEALKMCLEYIETNAHERKYVRHAIKEALVQPQQEPDRVKFERHWRKTRGEKKANRELLRHSLQPQTYIQDSANRHWITWQAAVRSVASQAQRKPLTINEVEQILAQHSYEIHGDRARYIVRMTEEAHGIKENT